MYITAAGTRMLVLNSHRAANDLLDRRGHIYSDRPRMISEWRRDGPGPWRILTWLLCQ